MASNAAPLPPATRPSTATLMRSTLVVGGVRGADFLLSFMVSVLLANRFGAGGQLDAFFLARRTTVGFADTIRKLVAQIVLPAVVAQSAAGGHFTLRHLPRRVYLFLIGFAVLTLIGIFIPSALVTAFAPGFSGERHDLTARMMTIMMPLLPMAVAASLLAALLQAHRKFWLSEGTNLVQRALLVVVLAFAIPPLGIIAGAWTMLGSGLVGTAILFVGAWPILRRRPSRVIAPAVLAEADDPTIVQDPTTPATPRIGGGIAAAVVLAAYFQASTLIDFAVASTTGEGGVAALEYGARLVSLVPGLVMSSLFTVLQPELIRTMQDPDPTRAAQGLARYQRIGFFAQVPVSIGMMLGSELMVRILFGYGSFGESSILLAAGTTAGYAAAAIFLTPFSATTSAIYADPRASCLRDLAVISVWGVVLRGAIVFVGARWFGAPGIAWAAALATALTFVVAQKVAIDRFRGFDLSNQARDFARSLLCGGLAAGGAWLLLVQTAALTGTLAAIARLAGIGLVVVAIYIAAALILRVPEIVAVREIARKALGRKLSRHPAGRRDA